MREHHSKQAFLSLNFILTCFKEGKKLKEYILTVFNKDGEKLLDESFYTNNICEAKAIGEKRLDDKDYRNHTHRCVSEDAKLVLFHR